MAGRQAGKELVFKVTYDMNAYTLRNQSLQSVKYLLYHPLSLCLTQYEKFMDFQVTCPYKFHKLGRTTKAPNLGAS